NRLARRVPHIRVGSMTTIPMTTRPPVMLPWGVGGSLPLALPPLWPAADIVWPDVAGAIPDYSAALTRALDAPEGMPRLEEQVRRGRRVAIVVDDPSRWTPVRTALPIVLERLKASGLDAGAVTISVGVGRHHAVDAGAMRTRVGDAVADAYRCY